MRRIDTQCLGAPLTGYLHEVSAEIQRPKRPAVIICPGGGYAFLSDRENEPPAMALFARGYQVFVLEYAVGAAAANLRPLCQLSRAVALVRERAVLWQVDPAAIAVMGFSAGGHLAASLGVHWGSDRLLAALKDCPAGRNRPDAMALCYPVIVAGRFAHQDSLARVSGGDKELEDFFSLERHVTGQTPPAFIWHTADDQSVPAQNALWMAAALGQAGVGYELHIFEKGQHGLSMCSREVGAPNPDCAPWLDMCVAFLNRQFDFAP